MDDDAASTSPVRGARSRHEPGSPAPRSQAGRGVGQLRQRLKRALTSKKKHYGILVLIGIDVAVILSAVFIELIACDMGKTDEPWVHEVTEALNIVAIAISGIFLVELTLTVCAFGWRFFSSWFHCFDAAVIVSSFAVDIIVHGVAEEIASLVIILRLWRFLKIIDEIGVGAEERMEAMTERIEKLEKENEELQRLVQRRDADLEGG